MKNKHIYFRSLFAFCLVFVLSVNVFCSGAITDTQTYLTFFENPAMNSRILNSYTSALPAEKKEFIKTCIPIIAQKMGFPSALSTYTILNLYYQNPRSIVISHYGNDSDSYNQFLHDYRLNFDKSAGAISDLSAKSNRDLIMKFEPSFLGNDIDGFYTDLGEYCVKTLYHDDSSNQLVGNRDFTTNVYNLADYIADEKVGESGVQNVLLGSYFGIAPSFWNNNTIYDGLNTLVNEHLSAKYVVLYCTKVPYSSSYQYWAIFPKVSSNLSLYMSSPSLANPLTNLYFCDANGVQRTIFSNSSYYDIYKLNGTTWSTNNIYNGNWGSGFDAGMRNFVGNPVTNSVPCIYTVNRSDTTYTVFNSLSSWNNNHGEWVNPYIMPNFVSPSVTYGAQDMSRTYNSIVSGSNNNTTNNYFGDNIVYPDTFVPDSTNGYDEETNTLKFGSIIEFLKSIGNFLGSIINGIAGGLANIFNALSTITQNILNLINQGFMGFMSALFGWLPAEIVAVISGGIVLIVLFGIIKVIRG